MEQAGFDFSSGEVGPPAGSFVEGTDLR